MSGRSSDPVDALVGRNIHIHRIDKGPIWESGSASPSSRYRNTSRARTGLVAAGYTKLPSEGLVVITSLSSGWKAQGPALRRGRFYSSLSGDRPRSRSESLMTLPGGLAESPALVRSAFCRRLLP